jgi:acetyl esterase/lipase
MGGRDPAQPLASPLFASYPDPPPILIQVGSDEVLLSDSKGIALATGATLDIWPDCPHVWQLFDGRLPEANAAMRKAAEFIHSSFESAKR